MTTDRPDIHLLADLDAGLLDEPRAAQVRAAALADPPSAAVLDALAATRAELAALPLPPVPAAAEARWAAAVEQAALRHGASESGAGPTGVPSGTAPLIPPDSTARVPSGAGARAPVSRRSPAGPPSRPRSRRRRPRPAVVAGVLLIAVLVVVGLVRSRPTPTTVTRVELVTAARAALGVGDAGEFTDPARRAACLRSVAPPGVTMDSPLLGGRTVELDGRPGVLMVLGTGVLGSFDVVVVGPGCDALLANLRVGR